MTAKPTRTINPGRVQNRLDKAAGRCCGAFNSFLGFLGDKCELYAIGPYRSGQAQAIVCNQAPGMAQQRAALAQGSDTSGEDRAMRIEREETAFMTLIGHECAGATLSPIGDSVRSVGPL